MDEQKSIQEKLFEALENGQIETAIGIINKLPNLNFYNKNGKTALHIAAAKGFDNIIKKLIDKGADVNLTDKDGKTPLHVAAHRSCEKTMIELLKSPKIQIDKTDNLGQTALHIAVFHNSNNIAQILISKNCNTNICDIFGQTPLHIASYNKNKNIIKKLIDGKADINIVDNQDLKPIDIAGFSNDEELIELLSPKDNIKNQKEFKKLDGIKLDNPSNQDLSSEKQLLNNNQNNKNLNEDNSFNEKDKLIEDISKDLNLFQNYQQRFLDHKKQLEDKNNLNESNNNSLESDFKDITKTELDSIKKELNSGKSNESLLLEACETGKTRIAIYLIQKISNVNFTNNNSQTPLHIAAKNSNSDIMFALIRAGADTNIRDKSNNTAEDIFKNKSNLESNKTDFKIKDFKLLETISEQLPKNSTNIKQEEKIQKLSPKIDKGIEK